MKHLVAICLGSVAALVQAQGPPVFPSKPGMTIMPKHRPQTDTILWSGPTRLTWADYQGTVPSPRPGASATTLRLLAQPEIAADGAVTWYIHPVFSRSRSWVVAHPHDPDKLLAHEHLHFDLAEVYARMVRKYIVEHPPKTHSTDEGRMMNSRIASLRAELESEGVRYDVETGHGTDDAAQAKWAASINQRLKELRGWRWGACGLHER